MNKYDVMSHVTTDNRLFDSAEAPNIDNEEKQEQRPAGVKHTNMKQIHR